jgi:hypothetical protein
VTNELRKRMKSVGERPPHTNPNVIDDDKRQKLKELTLQKQKELPKPPVKEVIPQPFDANVKIQKSGTVKVN